MKKLNKAKEDKLLLDIVRILSSEFPNCSLTSDLDCYPLSTGCIIVNVLGVSEEEALEVVRKVEPAYSLEGADVDEFTVFLCFNAESPEIHDLKEALLDGRVSTRL